MIVTFWAIFEKPHYYVKLLCQLLVQLLGYFLLQHMATLLRANLGTHVKVDSDRISAYILLSCYGLNDNLFTGLIKKLTTGPDPSEKVSIYLCSTLNFKHSERVDLR